MTKKAKKKAIKTGARAAETPRVTSHNLNSMDPLISKGRCASPRPEDPSEEYTFALVKTSRKDRIRLNRLEEEKRLEAYRQENILRTVYPNDLWFLIASYLAPESVTVFARLCKGAHHVVTTAKFWLTLYRRFVLDHKILPSHLKPAEIAVKTGLRARVVRALFFVYPPLATKVDHGDPISQHVQVVVNKQCLMLWWKPLASSKKHSNFWLFYLKFSLREKISQKSVLESQDLLSYNTESDFALLRLASPSFMLIKDVSGLTLSDVSVSVSSDMRCHKVKLTFHETRRDSKYQKHLGYVVTVDPVFDLQVLRWWDPQYPHPLDH